MSRTKDFENAPVGATATNSNGFGRAMKLGNVEQRWVLQSGLSMSDREMEFWGYTLDPLPDPEPDWLDAPAVLARGKHWEAGQNLNVFTRSVDMWALYGCNRLFHWSELADVTPLYPKEGQDA